MASDKTMERIVGVEWFLTGVQRGVFTSDPQGDWALCLRPSDNPKNEADVLELKKLYAFESKRIHLEDGICLDFGRGPDGDGIKVALMLDAYKAEAIMRRTGIDITPFSFLDPVNAINEMMEVVKNIWVFAGERRLAVAVEAKKQASQDKTPDNAKACAASETGENPK
jgi:hypothetical protein